jgi:hypothetical protein
MGNGNNGIFECGNCTMGKCHQGKPIGGQELENVMIWCTQSWPDDLDPVDEGVDVFETLHPDPTFLCTLAASTWARSTQTPR